MKRLLLASVGLVALGIAAPASAADLGVRRGPAVAPVAVAPIFSWTGFYIGAHIGWAHAELDSTLVDPFFPFVAGTTIGNGGQDGFLGGATAGFNYQVGQFVWGIEGQISWTDLGRDGSISVTGPIGTNFIDHSTDVNFVATLAARLGVAFGNALWYAKGGFAFLDWSSTVTFRGPDVTNGSVSFGDTEFGWMVGVGLEYGFTPNWSAKIEYNFMSFDLDDHRFTFGGLNSRFDNDLDVHVVKAGINYRFGGKAPLAPVTARY
jgi:outer membrane immunogenic protein